MTAGDEWAGKTNRHGRGGGAKVTVMDAGCAGRAPLGKWRATAIPWREEGTAGRELTVPDRTRHDTARGGTGYSCVGTAATGEHGLGTPRAQHSSHREHGPRALTVAGRGVAVLRRAAPYPRTAPRTGQQPERLYGHRQSRAVSGTGATLGHRWGTLVARDSGAQGRARHGGVPGPAGLHLPPAVVHSTVSPHGDRGAGGSSPASQTLPGLGAGPPGESRWRRGRGGPGPGRTQPPRGWPGRGCPRGSGPTGPLRLRRAAPAASRAAPAPRGSFQHGRAFPELQTNTHRFPPPRPGDCVRELSDSCLPRPKSAHISV